MYYLTFTWLVYKHWQSDQNVLMLAIYPHVNIDMLLTNMESSECGIVPTGIHISWQVVIQAKSLNIRQLCANQIKL